MRIFQARYCEMRLWMCRDLLSLSHLLQCPTAAESFKALLNALFCISLVHTSISPFLQQKNDFLWKKVQRD